MLFLFELIVIWNLETPSYGCFLQFFDYQVPLEWLLLGNLMVSDSETDDNI
jgi:hypothetical protein